MKRIDEYVADTLEQIPIDDRSKDATLIHASYAAFELSQLGFDRTAPDRVQADQISRAADAVLADCAKARSAREIEPLLPDLQLDDEDDWIPVSASHLQYLEEQVVRAQQRYEDARKALREAEAAYDAERANAAASTHSDERVD
ncbi:hypothetical protein OAF73_00800 [Planctomycetota bacterium]|nr:hypothetical protein [Planctomycetota bacterium]